MTKSELSNSIFFNCYNRSFYIGKCTYFIAVLVHAISYTFFWQQIVYHFVYTSFTNVTSNIDGLARHTSNDLTENEFVNVFPENENCEPSILHINARSLYKKYWLN